MCLLRPKKLDFVELGLQALLTAELHAHQCHIHTVLDECTSTHVLHLFFKLGSHAATSSSAQHSLLECAAKNSRDGHPCQEEVAQVGNALLVDRGHLQVSKREWRDWKHHCAEEQHPRQPTHATGRAPQRHAPLRAQQGTCPLCCKCNHSAVRAQARVHHAALAASDIVRESAALPAEGGSPGG